MPAVWVGCDCGVRAVHLYQRGLVCGWNKLGGCASRSGNEDGGADAVRVIVRVGNESNIVGLTRGAEAVRVIVRVKRGSRNSRGDRYELKAAGSKRSVEDSWVRVRVRCLYGGVGAWSFRS